MRCDFGHEFIDEVVNTIAAKAAYRSLSFARKHKSARIRFFAALTSACLETPGMHTFYSNYAWKNRRVAVRGVPITISKNAKKRVYIGEKQSEIDDSYWNKGILTVKVEKAYRTIYVNSYGMVTKVLNGKDK